MSGPVKISSESSHSVLATNFERSAIIMASINRWRHCGSDF